MSDIQKGNKITLAFQYVQQVCKECQHLIFKIDNLMAPEWGNVYGNRITKEVSASLQEAERWIIEAIFRVYQNDKDILVNKCISLNALGAFTDIQNMFDAQLGKIQFELPEEILSKCEEFKNKLK